MSTNQVPLSHARWPASRPVEAATRHTPQRRPFRPRRGRLPPADDCSGDDGDGVRGERDREADAEGDVRGQGKPERSVRQERRAPHERPADRRSTGGAHPDGEQRADQPERGRHHETRPDREPAPDEQDRRACSGRDDPDGNQKRERLPPGGKQLPDRGVVAVGVSGSRVVRVLRHPRQRVPAVGERGKGNRDAYGDTPGHERAEAAPEVRAGLHVRRWRRRGGSGSAIPEPGCAMSRCARRAQRRRVFRSQTGGRARKVRRNAISTNVPSSIARPEAVPAAASTLNSDQVAFCSNTRRRPSCVQRQ